VDERQGFSATFQFIAATADSLLHQQSRPPVTEQLPSLPASPHGVSTGLQSPGVKPSESLPGNLPSLTSSDIMIICSFFVIHLTSILFGVLIMNCFDTAIFIRFDDEFRRFYVQIASLPPNVLHALVLRSDSFQKMAKNVRT